MAGFILFVESLITQRLRGTIRQRTGGPITAGFARKELVQVSDDPSSPNDEFKTEWVNQLKPGTELNMELVARIIESETCTGFPDIQRFFMERHGHELDIDTISRYCRQLKVVKIPIPKSGLYQLRLSHVLLPEDFHVELTEMMRVHCMEVKAWGTPGNESRVRGMVKIRTTANVAKAIQRLIKQLIRRRQVPYVSIFSVLHDGDDEVLIFARIGKTKELYEHFKNMI